MKLEHGEVCDSQNNVNSILTCRRVMSRYKQLRAYVYECDPKKCPEASSAIATHVLVMSVLQL